MRLYLLAPGLLLGMVGLAASWFGPRKDSDVSWLRQWETGFFTHAHLFALGMLLAVLLADVQDGRVRLPRAGDRMTIATLIVCGLGTVWLADGQRVPERIEVCLVAVCCALLLASTVLGDPRTSRLVRVLDSRPLIWAGLVSIQRLPLAHARDRLDARPRPRATRPGSRSSGTCCSSRPSRPPCPT